MSDSGLLSASEIKELADSEVENKEFQYRRGFVHGMFYMFDAAFNHGASDEEAYEYFRFMIYWRHHKEGEPPCFEKFKKEKKKKGVDHE